MKYYVVGPVTTVVLPKAYRGKSSASSVAHAVAVRCGITNKQIQAVRVDSHDQGAARHAVEPLVHVGSAGVTGALIAEASRALTARELITVAR